jgi:hypothetical protein
VRAFRLARHRLDRRAPAGSMLEVTGAICGLHAQLASSAELSLWARVEDVARDDVRDAVEKHRTLVKTWAMRGTLHLVLAEDLPLFIPVWRTRWEGSLGAWQRGHGVTEAQYEAIVDAVPRALGDRVLTREELADEIARLAGDELRELLLSGWGALLKPSAHRGELVFGPSRGRNVTFVRREHWLGAQPEPEPDDAARAVAERYLGAYGPATADDFGRWIGLRGAVVRRTFAAAPDTVEVDRDGRSARLREADLPDLEAASARSVRLLPAFDPYVIGFQPRSGLVSTEHEARIFRPQGWLSPVLLVDGAAAGVWSYEKRGRRVDVDLEPFGKLSPATRKAARGEADRLGEFLGAPAELSVAWASVRE